MTDSFLLTKILSGSQLTKWKSIFWGFFSLFLSNLLQCWTQWTLSHVNFACSCESVKGNYDSSIPLAISCKLIPVFVNHWALNNSCNGKSSSSSWILKLSSVISGGLKTNTILCAAISMKMLSRLKLWFWFTFALLVTSTTTQKNPWSLRLKSVTGSAL